MHYQKGFFRNTGAWGVASVSAALLVFGLALWEHAHDKPVSAFVFVCLSIPLFWVGSLVAWRKAAQEVDRLNEKLSYLEIESGIAELYAIHADDGKWGTTYGSQYRSRMHLFVRARVELKSPKETYVSAYRCEYLLHGVPHTLTWHQDDVTAWVYREIRNSHTQRMEEIPLVALPMKLVRGAPSDGWVHFVTDADTTDENLRCSNVRLLIETPIGTGYAEEDGICWIPGPYKSIGRVKKATESSGNVMMPRYDETS